MKKLVCITTLKKYLVVICFVISVILIVIASRVYPGGSFIDKNAIGFNWLQNFMSNLFTSKALNGSENSGWILALIGMAFHSVAYGIFFINMSKKIVSKPWTAILKYIGIANMILIFLIATPLHDLGVFSIILTLLGLFTITIFILKSKLHVFKFFCISCLLTYYCFFIFYGISYWSIAIILQKVYMICSMLLVLGLEYFTKQKDYV